MSPCIAPESAIRPSVPSPNQVLRSSARPRYWFSSQARVRSSDNLR